MWSQQNKKSIIMENLKPDLKSPLFRAICTQKAIGMKDKTICMLINLGLKIPEKEVQALLDRIQEVVMDGQTIQVRMKPEIHNVHVSTNLH
jgi:hypothetical protein